ncbi:MAG TPA: CdaR family protein [Blastocatellia bacterium]|jgi:YbbR domain-containing protein|nr:CdaR family protein [Blastocatellia bacterium]
MDRVLHYLVLLKEYGKDYILENTGLKVLALLITGVLWLSVASRPVAQVAFNNVPIVFKNLPESPNLTISKSEPLSARVYLEGPRDQLDSLRASEVTVVGDMEGVEPGIRLISLQLDRSRFPASVKVREISPSSIRVTVERVIEKEVRVSPQFEGQPPSGYEVINWQISPATVRVEGAESEVRDIIEVSTETVSLAGKTEPFSDLVKIIIGSPTLNVSDEGALKGKVMLSVNVGEVQKERVIDRVPVETVGAPPGAQASPIYVKVKLRGAHSAIDAMTASDLNVTAEYPADRKGPHQLTPSVTVSPHFADHVTVESVEPATVRVK